MLHEQLPKLSFGVDEVIGRAGTQDIFSTKVHSSKPFKVSENEATGQLMRGHFEAKVMTDLPMQACASVVWKASSKSSNE